MRATHSITDFTTGGQPETDHPNYITSPSDLELNVVDDNTVSYSLVHVVPDSKTGAVKGAAYETGTLTFNEDGLISGWNPETGEDAGEGMTKRNRLI